MAETIALVVHGVGDHSATALLDEAAKGFRALTADTGSVAPMTLRAFPRPDGTTGDQPALLLGAGGTTHIVIPIIWSALSLRAAVATRSVFTNDAVQILGRSGIALIRLCVDSIRCIPLAAGLWKVPLVLISAAVMALVAGLWWAVIYLQSHIPFWLGVAGTSQWRWYTPLLIFAAIAAVTELFARTLPLLDFVADVVTYVAGRKRRERVLQAVAAMIDRVASGNRGARVVVVGHSLGSVLVSQAVLRAQSPGGVVLLTLGSPLRLLSRIFPRQIDSPDALLRRYAETGKVAFWANLWRDRDAIGRQLKLPEESGRFAECSVGDGPHWNMWGDVRVWKRVHEMLTAPSASELMEAWKNEPLTEQEERELAVRAHRIRLADRILPYLLFAWPLHGWLSRADWEKLPRPVYQSLIAIYSVLSMLMLLAVVRLGVAGVRLKADGPPRVLLGALRRDFAFLRACLTLTVIFAVAAATLFFSSTAGVLDARKAVPVPHRARSHAGPVDEVVADDDRARGERAGDADRGDP